MMKKNLTILVPTYNMEKYLCRCLDSLIIGKGLKNLEVLVINDGSSDCSSEIAHRYEDKYPNVFRVIDKENGNYGSCINVGLKEANGKYIKILDADDYYNTRELSLLVERLGQVEVDAVITPHSVFNKNQLKERITFPMYQDGQIVNVDMDMVEYFTMDNIAYRTELLLQINYYQSEGISYTDQEWIFYPMEKVEEIMFMDLDIYQYMTGHEGQTMELSTYYKRIGQVEFIVIRMLKHILLIDNLRQNRRFFLLSIIYGQTRIIYKVELLVSNNFNEEELNEIEKRWKNVDKDYYDRLGRITNDKYLPIYYVNLWRKSGVRMSKWKRNLLLNSCCFFQKIRKKIKSVYLVCKCINIISLL